MRTSYPTVDRKVRYQHDDGRGHPIPLSPSDCLVSSHHIPGRHCILVSKISLRTA